MSEHTKEPWTYGHVGDDFWIGDNSDGLNNLARVYWDMGEIPEGRANARRIVACVNACSGVKTEDLEALSGTAILEIANTQFATLKRQRDMLLEALKANEAFVTEMVTFGGKYSFLNGTDIIPDAYAQLKRMSVAIATVEGE